MDYASDHGVDIRHRFAPVSAYSYSSRGYTYCIPLRERLIDYFQRGLLTDTPIPLFIGLDEVNIYYQLKSDNNLNREEGVYQTKYHWVNVTGIHVDREIDEAYVIVSSWGYKIYIDIDELSEVDFRGVYYEIA